MLDLYDALKEHYYPEDAPNGEKADEESAEKNAGDGEEYDDKRPIQVAIVAGRTSANRRWSMPFCRTNGC